jgi:hypothetical protein
MKIKIHIKYNSNSKKKAGADIIKFIPEEAKVKWDDIEIHPVFQDLEGYCDVVEEGKETFWSIYIHQVQGGARCIADVPTKQDALKFAELINMLTITRLRKHRTIDPVKKQ